MIRFGFQFVMVLFTILGMEYTVPALGAVDHTHLAEAAAFIALLNAAIRPVLGLAGWPTAPAPLGVVVLTANGILFSLAGPVFSGWTVTSLWAGAAIVVVTSIISTAIGSAEP